MSISIAASEIPSIAQLYKLTELRPAETNQSISNPANQSFNDRIGLIRGDITKLAVDAIVNAANTSLLGGGGVDGAIHAAAGSKLVEECEKLNGCQTGNAKITDAYELPCKKVIHTVGPVYRREQAGKCAKLLSGCYRESLKVAVANKVRSIAFSAISTGVYGYPSEDAAHVALETVREFLETSDGEKLDLVTFVTFVKKDVVAYNESIPLYFPPTEQDLNQADDWEEVQPSGSSADNGSLSEPRQKTEEINAANLEEVKDVKL